MAEVLARSAARSHFNSRSASAECWLCFPGRKAASSLSVGSIRTGEHCLSGGCVLISLMSEENIKSTNLFKSVLLWLTTRFCSLSVWAVMLQSINYSLLEIQSSLIIDTTCDYITHHVSVRSWGFRDPFKSRCRCMWALGWGGRDTVPFWCFWWCRFETRGIWGRSQ